MKCWIVSSLPVDLSQDVQSDSDSRLEVKLLGKLVVLVAIRGAAKLSFIEIIFYDLFLLEVFFFRIVN